MASAEHERNRYLRLLRGLARQSVGADRANVLDRIEHVLDIPRSAAEGDNASDEEQP